MGSSINMGSSIFVRFLTGNMPYEENVEIVERKGVGHPDTICDNVAEQVSIALCRYYLEEFGAVMHHNVDKGLLVAGIADPSYGGGKVVKPIEVIIAGRGIKDKNGSYLPIDEIAVEAVNKWLRQNIRHLDTEKVVPLPEQIPVYVLYLTAWVDEDGTVQFRKDIYGHDREMNEDSCENPYTIQ